MKLETILSLFTAHGLLSPDVPGKQHLPSCQKIFGKPVTDNRQVMPGYIFVCIKGLASDGHDYAVDAISRGAGMVICQESFVHKTGFPIGGGNDKGAGFPIGVGNDKGTGFPIGVGNDCYDGLLMVSDTRKAAALLAGLYYKNPSHALKVIGVTGTNGKTTTSMLIYQALNALGKRCGWIGTLGYYLDGVLFPTNHTTPDFLELNEIMAKMVERGVEYLAMEVSSHALALHRVYGMRFEYCLFTNLSRDHLDFHKDMDDYAETKYKLFVADQYELAAIKQLNLQNQGQLPRKNRFAIVNTDDEFGKTIHDRLGCLGHPVVSFGQKKETLYRIEVINTDLNGSEFRIMTSDSEYHIKTPLIGIHNIYNLTMTFVLLKQELLKLPKDIQKTIMQLTGVCGRMQAVPNNQGIGIYIDYAHTPDAMENVLKAARSILTANRKLPRQNDLTSAHHNRIITVFGAGGDRDKGKRSLMLQTALALSGAVIITDDNPRSENGDKIILDIVQATNIWLPWWIIRDRKEAIRAALNLAREGDIVMILGKGHEEYQEINGVKHPFSDLHTIQDILCESEPGAKGSEFGARGTTSAKAEQDLVLPFDRLLLDILLGSESGARFSLQRALYHRICTDSRKVIPGSIFIAIKGERFDGHEFIRDLTAVPDIACIGSAPFDDGICPQPKITNSFIYYSCRNSLEVYATLCRKYLLMFTAEKIALTGSVGKTTTKEIIHNLLSSKAPTLKSVKNENNIIGLCQTILRIAPKHDYAVFEIGTNHFGEIAFLADTCFPDIGLILNIGPSHLEFLIDEDGVFREKTALFNRPLRLRLFPADDNRFSIFERSGKSVGYSGRACYRISDCEEGEPACNFKVNGLPYKQGVPVSFYKTNAAFAVALGMELGFSHEEIKEAIALPFEQDMRMEVLSLESGKLIADCYNANPLSMHSAIEFWKDLDPKSPHFAILGDMLELGEQSENYHQMIGTILSETGIENIISIGTLSKLYHAKALGTEPEARSKEPGALSSVPHALSHHFPSVKDMISSGIINLIPVNSIILLKASHGLHLEELIPYFIQPRAQSSEHPAPKGTRN